MYWGYIRLVLQRSLFKTIVCWNPIRARRWNNIGYLSQLTEKHFNKPAALFDPSFQRAMYGGALQILNMVFLIPWENVLQFT